MKRIRSALALLAAVIVSAGSTAVGAPPPDTPLDERMDRYEDARIEEADDPMLRDDEDVRPEVEAPAPTPKKAVVAPAPEPTPAPRVRRGHTLGNTKDLRRRR